MATIRHGGRACSLAIVLMYVASPLCGQTVTLQDQLNSTYKGKIFVLRNFYSGTDLEYDQNGILLSRASSGPWTLSGVEITDISITMQSIEVVGNRLGTLFQDQKTRLVRIGKVQVHIAKPVSDADSEASLRPLFSKILVRLGEDLRPSVPDYWRYFLTEKDPHARSTAWETDLERSNVSPQGPVIRRGVPKALHAPDPKYTKEAQANHIEGRSVLGVVVDATGTASNISILEPLGMGLDEQAVLAVEHWKFSPSTLNGQPVPVHFHVEINFRCCP